MVRSQAPGSANVTSFGCRVFADGVELRRGGEGAEWPREKQTPPRGTGAQGEDSRDEGGDVTHLSRSQAEGPRPRPPRAEAGEAPPPQARWETPVGLPAYVPVVINGVPHSLPPVGLTS